MASPDSRPASKGSLERARRVQLGMLPRTPVIPGLEIHAHYAPCDQVGGDFYDLVSVGDGRLAVVVGDVAGHGLDAGGLLGRAGQGHGEKIKNLLEYERDETDEHDYGSGVDTDEEIDDLDDF